MMDPTLMTSPPAAGATDDVEALLAAAPPELVLIDARERIAEDNRRAGRRIGVLDDDPTGAQSVHDVQVVTVYDQAEYRSALTSPGAVCFVLTNSRSLDEVEARTLNHRVAADLYALEPDHGGTTELVSRSDSCLRGHVLAEIAELSAASEEVTGRAVDGVLFVPALFAAGRFTIGDVHYAMVDGTPTPVADTEYARDATFGYTQSRLTDFLVEKSGNSIAADSVLSIPLQVIRGGGPEAVADILRQATHGRWIVVNALSDHDLDVVVLGLVIARREGRTFLYRSGPSFVRALAGIEPRPLLDADDFRCAPLSTGHGLVVVGSHTRCTTAQVEALQQRFSPIEIELDVAALLDPGRRADHIRQTAQRVVEALRHGDVLLATSRRLTRGHDAAASLEIARTVSSGLVETVARSRTARPSWVLAKGGITSHDVAVRGLGINRARVAGQLLPGISLFLPVDAPEDVLQTPYVVFPGNVGGAEAVADAVAILRAAAHAPAPPDHAPAPPAHAPAPPAYPHDPSRVEEKP